MKQNKMKSSKKSKKLYLIVLAFVAALVLTVVNAYTTNSTEKTFGFAITSGATDLARSGNFSTWMVVGDIASTLSSSNFKTEVGFLRTTGYITGESCDIDNDCPNGKCCSNACQSECPSAPIPPTPHTSSGSGRTGGTPVTLPVAQNSYSRFFDVITANQELIFSISNPDLPVIEVKLMTSQNLEGISISFSPVASPQFTLDNAYYYFEVLSDKLNSGNLASFIFKFKVKIDSGYIKESVSLNKYNNGWVKLPTKLVSQDSEYYYYESNTNGFSLFAITGQKKLAEAQKEPEQQSPLVIGEEEEQKDMSQSAPESKKVEETQQQAIAAKDKPKFGKVFLGIGITALLFSLIFLLVNSYPKLKLRHLKKEYGDFNYSLRKCLYLIKNDEIAEAKKSYIQLLSNYNELIKYPINRNMKIYMFKSVKYMHDRIVMMVNAKKYEIK
ncbi:PGF-pre-PGF domain-containing protein [Candidatus Woesearchaeota archaeon]|nr:PGF-pre-PGF domain-containing protein [Candidatus Woesearchaeota archaeon]